MVFRKNRESSKSKDNIQSVCALWPAVSTLCDPRDCSPPGSSVHGISQARILGVGFHFLLQGIFPIQGASPHLLCLLPCRWIFYLLGHLSSRWPELRVRQNFRKKTAILVPLETARSRLGYRARELRGTLAVPTSTRLHQGGSSVPTQGSSTWKSPCRFHGGGNQQWELEQVEGPEEGAAGLRLSSRTQGDKTLHSELGTDPGAGGLELSAGW